MCRKPNTVSTQESLSKRPGDAEPIVLTVCVSGSFTLRRVLEKSSHACKGGWRRGVFHEFGERERPCNSEVLAEITQ